MANVKQKILLYTVGYLTLRGVIGAVTNWVDGKTITGKKRKNISHETTYVDFRENIRLGTRDYVIR